MKLIAHPGRVNKAVGEKEYLENGLEEEKGGGADL
jgi:hypothetical protein